ncbi:MAG: hypothetical protein AAGA56_17530, partial [Myxococcota bacterium]
GESPRLTRFAVSRDGFTEVATLAFDDLLTPTRFFSAPNFAFVSETKAYLFDPIAGEVIVFDPSQMLERGRFSIPRDNVPGNMFPVLGFTPTVLDSGRVLYSVGFANSVDDVVSSTSLLVVIDTNDDEIVQALTTDVCGYLIHAYPKREGDIWFSTGAFSAAVGATTEGERAGPSCVVELSSELSFAEEPLAPPTALTGGAPAGSYIFVDERSAFMRVLATDVVPEPAQLETIELNNGGFWRWGYIADVTDPSSFELVDGSSLGGGYTRVLNVDERRFAVESRADFSGSQLIELRPNGTLVRGIESRQTITNVIPLQL